MSGESAKPPATYEDLLGPPDHLVAEIVDGELVTSPGQHFATRAPRRVSTAPSSVRSTEEEGAAAPADG